MATIAILPTPLARASAASVNPRNRSTCGIYDVAGRLGQAHRTSTWLCNYIDKLVAQAGFPAPFPLVRGAKLVDRVHADSRWPLVAVEAWFDGHLPPAARGAADVAERVEIDSRLNANAARLFEDEVA